MRGLGRSAACALTHGSHAPAQPHKRDCALINQITIQPRSLPLFERGPEGDLPLAGIPAKARVKANPPCPPFSKGGNAVRDREVDSLRPSTECANRAIEIRVASTVRLPRRKPNACPYRGGLKRTSATNSPMHATHQRRERDLLVARVFVLEPLAIALGGGRIGEQFERGAHHHLVGLR